MTLPTITCPRVPQPAHKVRIIFQPHSRHRLFDLELVLRR